MSFLYSLGILSILIPVVVFVSAKLAELFEVCYS